MRKRLFATFIVILILGLAATNCVAEQNIQRGDVIETNTGHIWVVTRVDDDLIYFIPHLRSKEDIIFLNWIKKGNGHVLKYGTKEHCQKAAAFMKQE